MKRFLSSLSLVVFSASATTVAFAQTSSHPSSATPGAATHTTVKAAVDYDKHPELLHHGGIYAPADEYFGRLKMSVLGMRNQLKDMSAKIDYEPQKAAGHLGMADLTEDAMHDWEKKYPRDPWLPKYVLELTRFYQHSDDPEFQKRTVRALSWLETRYKTTRYAKTGREEYNNKLASRPNAPSAPVAEAKPAGFDITNPNAPLNAPASATAGNASAGK